MIKKRTAIFLSLVMSFSLLTGCNGNPAETEPAAESSAAESTADAEKPVETTPEETTPIVTEPDFSNPPDPDGTKRY